MRHPNEKKQQSSKAKPLAKLTLHGAAMEFGVGRETLRKRLGAAGIQSTTGSTYTIAQIHRALSAGGGLVAARTREAEERASLLSLERRRKQRELVSVAEVVDLIARILQPFRTRLLAAPAVLGAAANPSDPVHGMAAVTSWVDSVLPLLRDDVLKAFAAAPLEDDEEEAAE